MQNSMLPLLLRITANLKKILWLSPGLVALLTMSIRKKGVKVAIIQPEALEAIALKKSYLFSTPPL